jgi:hypothetical protein
MSGEEVVPVKPIPREKPLKAICIIILSIIVIVAAVSVFLRDGGTISSNVSWTILGICYVVFFPTFATLIKIDNENAPDGNPRAHKKVSN